MSLVSAKSSVITRARGAGLDVVFLIGIVLASIVLFAEIFPIAATSNRKLHPAHIIVPAQLSMGAGPRSIPPATKWIIPPAKPTSGLTPEQRVRLDEAIKRLTPKERNQLAKAMKSLTPEDRKRLAEAVKRQFAGAGKASQVARPAR